MTQIETQPAAKTIKGEMSFLGTLNTRDQLIISMCSQHSQPFYLVLVRNCKQKQLSIQDRSFCLLHSLIGCFPLLFSIVRNKKELNDHLNPSPSIQGREVKCDLAKATYTAKQNEDQNSNILLPRVQNFGVQSYRPLLKNLPSYIQQQCDVVGKSMGSVDKVIRLQILALLLSLATMGYHYTPTRTMFYLRNLGKILSLKVP